jgi:hypothetical protein
MLRRVLEGKEVLRPQAAASCPIEALLEILGVLDFPK